MGVTIENIIFDAGHLWLKRNYSTTNHFPSLDFWYVIAERVGFYLHIRSGVPQGQGQGQRLHMKTITSQHSDMSNLTTEKELVAVSSSMTPNSAQ